MIEPIVCDEVIFIPMIDGINITPDQVVEYENQNYKIPKYDRITPKIELANDNQDVEFFRDERSHIDRNSIQVRVMCSKKLVFESSEVYIKQKGNASCNMFSSSGKWVFKTAAQ